MLTKIIILTGVAIAAVIGMCLLGKAADGKAAADESDGTEN